MSDAYGDTAEQWAELLEDLLHHDPATWPKLERYFAGRAIELETEADAGTRMVRCADCRNSTTSNGIARCGAGVESGLPIGGFWASDRHLCPSYES